MLDEFMSTDFTLDINGIHLATRNGTVLLSRPHNGLSLTPPLNLPVTGV